MGTIQVAAIQMRARVGDVAGNLSHAESLVREAFRPGAEWVILPEFFTSAGAFAPSMLSAWLPLEGPAARQSGIRTTHGADALHRRGCFGGAPLPRPLASTILVKALIELLDADHQVFPGQAKTVTFTVPAK